MQESPPTPEADRIVELERENTWPLERNRRLSEAIAMVQATVVGIV